MPSSITPQDAAERDLRFWCGQTVACALVVRAHELGKVGIPPEHMREADLTSREVTNRIFDEAGPVENHEHQTAWMAAIAQKTFSWVNEYLDRDLTPSEG